MKERLANLRQVLGLNKSQFASTLNVSYGNVGDWERGRAKPGADALAAIVKTFNVSALWLLTGEGEMFPPSEPDHKPLPSPMEFNIGELNDEQKELLMLFAHLNENQKYAVKEFIKYQFRQPRSNENLSYSPPSFPPTEENSSGGETA